MGKPDNIDISDNLEAFTRKMRANNLPRVVIDGFSHYLEQLAAGETGLIYDRDILPVDDLEIPYAGDLDAYRSAGEQALKDSVMIRLNGGLGTGMGLTRAKSFIRVNEGMSFLEIIVRQAEASGARLALMNSFNTHGDTLDFLEKLHPAQMPLTFVQHKFPKILRENLMPATFPKNPKLEWNPPGHGDVFLALYTSGTLAALLDQGIRHALIANADNLGATLNPAILGYFVDGGFPFMMEVAEKRPSDVKGGHLAHGNNGGFLLRELAQCPENELDAFKNIERYRYFNTNNIWVDLPRIYDVIQREGWVPLPVIVNPKTLDPRDKNSPPVYQIEAAMGAAISLFENASAVCVPRGRFLPVKICADLLAMRSDCFIFGKRYRLVANPDRCLGKIKIKLDPAYYGKIDEFNQRFADGPPSLIDCESLTVEGDVRFETNVRLKGRVRIKNNGPEQAVITRGETVSGNLELQA